jgi:acetyl-CoA carboxylase biotin carboxyl carrier protein
MGRLPIGRPGEWHQRVHPGERTLMDIERIKELVKLMADNDLSEIHIHSGEERICLKRPGANAPAVIAAAPMAAPAAAPAAPAAAAPVAPADDLVPICSPMVGTFYAASSPDSPPFISIGSEVAEDTVICIVEAMKVMNEIKAELGGTVAKILVNNGQAVEFGQPLFLVKKRG